MTRILHFADLHLDRSFAGLGMASSEASKRREELRAVLRRIVDLVRSRLEQGVGEQPTAADRASLDRHRRAALDRIAEAAKLRAPFIASPESER